MAGPACSGGDRKLQLVLQHAEHQTGGPRVAGAAMSDDDSDEYEEAHVFDYTPPKQSTEPALQPRVAFKPSAARALPL